MSERAVGAKSGDWEGLLRYAAAAVVPSGTKVIHKR
jgi:hypothetical protein